MGEIIRVRNISYDKYEELILRRDALKKEAFHWDRSYVREFGDEILSVFQLKIECIKKKKTIEFCQAALNRGQAVDQQKLQDYLLKEMKSFQEQLEQMVSDNEAAKGAGPVTELVALEIKTIYHRMVKLIHPDINPLMEKSETLQELWQRIILAYNCNDLKMMQETEILVNKVLDELGNDVVEIEIPDLEEKMRELEEEIKRIIETDPYQYKFLLEDDTKVKEKKDALLEEKKSFEDYGKQLDDILKDMMEGGMGFIWKMD